MWLLYLKCKFFSFKNSLQSGLTTLKEQNMNFEADVSPIEQYENLLEDE